LKRAITFFCVLALSAALALPAAKALEPLIATAAVAPSTEAPTTEATTAEAPTTEAITTEATAAPLGITRENAPVLGTLCMATLALVLSIIALVRSGGSKKSAPNAAGNYQKYF
jgi:hypothetical protein